LLVLSALGKTVMHNLLCEILVNLVAEIVAILLFTMLGIAIYWCFYFRNRKSLLSFFGVNTGKRISIFLSRLTVKPGGTESLEPTSQGFYGPAISKLEYDGALLLHKQLESRVLGILPKSVQAWLNQNTVALKTLDVPIEVSPLPPIEEAVFQCNMVVLGTSIYNRVAHYYLKEFLPQNRERYFIYEKDPVTGERIIGIRQKGAQDTILQGRSHHREIAFVQRINIGVSDEGDMISIFICAGLGSSATYGSIRYLAENWKILQRKYQNSEFGVWLAFPNQAPNDDFVRSPEVYEAFHMT
jgi:hypothetical protein